MNIWRIFIDRPVMTTVLVSATTIFGTFAFMQLPVNELPNVDFPTIQVTAGLAGGNPENIAATVATPLERQFSTIAGLDSMTSVSSAGSTRITLQFNLDRDIDAAAQDVQTAISQAVRLLPPELDNAPRMRKVNPADSPIIYLALTAKNLPLTALNEYADNQISQRISTLPSVAQMLVFGSQKYAVRLYLDPNALVQRKLAIDDVSAALEKANSNLPSGTLDGRSKKFTVKTSGQLESAADFNSVVINYSDGTPVRFSDIGRAEDSVENNRAKTWFNGERSIVLAVQRQPGANTVEVVRSIRALLPDIRRQLPGDAKLEVLFDRSEFIGESIHEVEFTLMLAVVLVVLVVLAFLRNYYSTLIVAIVLPISLIGTFAAMFVLGYSLNNISLMALTLAVGFVVDDAIVVLENITRHMEMGKDRMTAAIDGTREIGFTVISMTLSLVAVFLPILFMGGILGRLFTEFSVTIGLAVLISGAVSLSLTPMLCSRYLQTSHRHGRFFDGFEKLFERVELGYRDSLQWSLHNRRFMLYLAGVILLATAWLFVVVPKGFIPRQDTGQITGSTRAEEGIVFEDLVAKQLQITDIIRKNPNVAAVQSSAGQAGGGVTGGNVGRLVIRLKPKSERSLSADEVIEELSKQTRGVEGMRLFLQNPPAINIGAQQSNAEFQLVLLGSDTDVLYRAAGELESVLRGEKILLDVNSNLELRNPELQIDILRDRAAALGITPQQIQSTLYDAYGARRVTSIYAASDQYSVLMQLDTRFQADINALGALHIKSANQQMVPLSSVATIRSGVGPLSISHFGQQPAVTLSFNIAPGVSLGDATNRVQQLARESLPQGVTTSLSGSAKTFQDSMTDLPVLLAVTILVIYMILAILYEHFAHPVTILTALPLAGFGALIMLIVFHQDLNIFSFVGIILLVGLVKKNGIMMVDFAVAARRDQQLSAVDAMVQACRVRFRPIMMTTLAAILATLPIALGYGAGAEARRPLGIAVVGGLVFSQFLTLYLTPAFYVSMEHVTQRWAEWKKSRQGA
ncbi:MAG: efflux RND transporter permease subunit [Sideroxyarcus sp.]|nr:efflux RND transporter permease subunit [Sideroxyarcus sp.]